MTSPNKPPDGPAATPRASNPQPDDAPQLPEIDLAASESLGQGAAEGFGGQPAELQLGDADLVPEPAFAMEQLVQVDSAFATGTLDDAEVDSIEVVYPEGGKPPPKRPGADQPAQSAPAAEAEPSSFPGASGSAIGTATEAAGVALEVANAAGSALSSFLTPERRLALLVDSALGLHLALAASLALQLLLPSVLPSFSEAWITQTLQGTPLGALPQFAYQAGALPWLLYGGLFASTFALLRRRGAGGLTHSPVAAFLDASVPVANVPGSFSLFHEAATAIEASTGRARFAVTVRRLLTAAAAATALELVARVARGGSGRRDLVVIAASILALAAQLGLLFYFYRGLRALLRSTTGATPRPPAPQVPSVGLSRANRRRRRLRIVGGTAVLAALIVLAAKAHGLCPAGARVAVAQGTEFSTFTCTDGAGRAHGRRLVVDTRGQPLLEEFFVGGQLEGSHVAFFGNGAVRELGDHRGGARHGEWSFFDETGRKLAQEPYSLGKLHGTAVRQLPEGREEVAYQSGQKHGLARRYDTAGKLVHWEMWAEDRLEAEGGPDLAIPTAKSAEPAAGEQALTATTVPPEMLFGGRTIAWWHSRLGTLKTRKDETGKRAYELTLKRLEANGLKAVERDRGLEIVPSRAVLERSAKRSGK